MKVILTCTGNTCRSPLAAAVWRRRRPQDAVRSAGLAALAGAPAAPEAVRVAAEAGLDLSDHRAHPLEAADLEAADLVVVMTEAQRREVVRRWPEGEARTVTLADLAGETGDVADPLGAGEAAYRRTLRQLEAWVEAADLRLAAGLGPGRVARCGAAAPYADLGTALVADLRQAGVRCTLGGPEEAVADLAAGRVAWALLVGGTGLDVAWEAVGRGAGPVLVAPWASAVQASGGGRVICLAAAAGQAEVRRAVGAYLGWGGAVTQGSAAPGPADPALGA